MSVNSFDELRQHIGHEIRCVGYAQDLAEDGAPIVFNTALECERCNEVLLDFDVEGDEETNGQVKDGRTVTR